jgi:CheY-like chemotaxis protein
MNGRILIVDDNAVNLKLASDVLEAAGFAIDRAVDAEQAQTLLTRIVPDLILLDIALPGMDGLTLTRKLKADARLKCVPIIALTACAMKGNDLKALEAGCTAYITKPLDTRQLARQMLTLLEAERAKGVFS